MQTIVLCCAAGMSTSMLVQKMKAEAQKRALDIVIEAVPVADFERIVERADNMNTHAFPNLLRPWVKLSR